MSTTTEARVAVATRLRRVVVVRSGRSDQIEIESSQHYKRHTSNKGDEQNLSNESYKGNKARPSNKIQQRKQGNM